MITTQQQTLETRLAEIELKLDTKENILNTIDKVLAARDGSFIGKDYEILCDLKKVIENDGDISQLIANNEVHSLFGAEFNDMEYKRRLVKAVYENATYHLVNGQYGYRISGSKLPQTQNGFITGRQLKDAIDYIYGRDPAMVLEDKLFLNKKSAQLEKGNPLSATAIAYLEKIFDKLDNSSEEPEIVVMKTRPNKRGEDSLMRMSKEEHQRQLDIANLVLNQSAGYLFASDRQAMEAFVDGEYHYGSILPGKVFKRARTFQERGIPPIFLQDFESVSKDGSLFPVLDYLIMIGADTLETKTVAKKLGTVRTHGYCTKALIPRSEPEDVISFAQRAFDDGKINPQFVRDLMFKVTNFTRASEERHIAYMANYPIAVQYLLESLEEFIPQKTKYSSGFNESTNASELKRIVESRRMWHLEYSPEDRVNIARAYLKCVAERQIPRNHVTLERICTLFVEENFDIGEIDTNRQSAEVREKYSQTRDSNNFYDVPTLILVDSQYADLKQDLMQRLEDMILDAKESQPEILLQPLHQYKDGGIYKDLGVPTGFLHIKSITNLLHDARYDILQGMTDEEFANRFPTQKHVAGFGVLNEDLGTTHHIVHDYVIQRYNELNTSEKIAN